MMKVTIFLTISLILFAALIILGVIFLIRFLKRYNVQLKKKKTLQQEELDKMKIEDLK
ncbi:hypothetical protein ACFQ5D_22685 [Paenibacillus farraposensis]|uniref:DUF4083 domain-containing protein n=1 Tax=Paenibacillus farraposensis TaxID=2807095 RepID=A0ABW4DL98_9BACL|nr:hypothetical protein [Paenibacillus farraposensis]MCC3378190.1 hypothetical protein [Paenibacillus farraposensis]